jgi:HD-GYP domain-containing protein (c-di-GMP phosphodiesterase class II)
MTRNGEAAPARPAWRAPLYVFIGTSFTFLVVVAGAIIGWHNYTQNRDLTITTTRDLFGALARQTRAELEAIQHPAELVVDLAAQQRLGLAKTLDERLGSAPFLITALEHAPALSALYAGYDNGDFFLLRRLANAPSVNAQFAPPAKSAFLAQNIEHDKDGLAHATYVFLDASAAVLERRPVADYAFDPRARDWYRQAQASPGLIRTAPYAFFTTHEVGITLARKSALGPAIIGADVTLSDLSNVLRKHLLSASTELILVTNDGTVLADRKAGRLYLESRGNLPARLATVADLGSPPLTALLKRFDPGAADSLIELSADGREWQAALTRLTDNVAGGDTYLALTVPRDELLGDARRITRSSALLTLVILLACIPVAWLVSRLVSKSLHQLTGEADAVRRFDFEKPLATRSAISEIGELAGTMDTMKRTIRRFLDIAATIAGERKFDRLLARVLAEVLPATQSRAGAIYLVDDRGVLKRAATQTLGARAPDVAAIDAEVPGGHVARRAIDARRTLVEPLDRDGEALLRELGAGEAPTSPGDVVAIPLWNRQHASVGALCLIQDTAQGEPTADQVAFAEALSGTVAVAIENQSLLLAQKELLEAFIRLVAGAIDAKSPYTGGHCQRVPELTQMLARAACDAKQGPFRDFAMSEDEWEALRIATWLHDCGKVTTPEYVVDKATKLETIYDRLHEIRTRFEVIKRDAGIDCWRRIADGGDRATLLRELEARHRELDAEFAFVAACNEGGESMAEESVARLREIGQRTWQRTLDDRIGIAREERERKERTPAQPLPVTEPLLADKPEHVIDRTASESIPPDNRWGFRLDPPAHKSDLGELHNLSIGRGTLTEEDRYRINDHIVRTIMMLSELPFTGHLRSVPELAGGHHERMDGKGYPKGLSRDEMSVQARMMAIADVFEALTAADRPYKRAKSLSESIEIMARMRDEHHLDPELFELFLTTGVYRTYAERFLDPAQIDGVDVSRYARAASTA